ncbi:hypothetical protein JAAARDRAFT_60240 [Jaapia argillacea MUCL 33604]|uniref:Major facilitator superfamily (MFS) profile domain-containing protein n=1 Tax=Jaapia argillacea MUCL 33604 TaxID=933084 RepID=A0A067PU14_9AGAM|nr:hypothetical protein JAAARDRAFT_60240 [Jaapia argillacea MUCL 33604]
MTHVMPSSPPTTVPYIEPTVPPRAMAPLGSEDASVIPVSECEDQESVSSHGSPFELYSPSLDSITSTLKGSSETGPNHKLSTLQLCVTHLGAAMTLFLATTDSTVVSTSLPTIVNELSASQTQYTWVGVAYLLTQTACQPLYGRISDLVGRKAILYASMIIFAIGSLLCGVAQNITWLILARGLAGVGGGGIVSAVWVITAEIVEVRDRAKWSQALSVTWSCSAIAGPVLGGLFSTTHSRIVSWRWIFYLNLPVCLIAFIILECSLHRVKLGPSKGTSWSELSQKFDFLGLLLFMSGTSCIIVGFSFAPVHGWTSPSTLSLIICGILLLFGGGFYEMRTTRDALFPQAVFKSVTGVAILIVTFLHNFAFNAGTFYLALYLQTVNGLSPVDAGFMMLPYSLGSSMVSMPAAWFIGYWQRRTKTTSGQKWVICLGLMVSTLGFGLLNLLRDKSPQSLQLVFPLIAGLGLGMLFHAPYQVFTRAIDTKDIAAGTSAFFLVRFTGATVGLAVAGAIFNLRLPHMLPQGLELYSSASSINLSSLQALQPPALKSEALRAVALSIRAIWTVCAPCLGFAALMSLCIRSVPVDTDVVSSSQEKLSPEHPPTQAKLTV